MKASQQTIQEIERSIRDAISKYPKDAEPVMTDISVMVNPETGGLTLFNDDEEVLASVIVHEWESSPMEDFYDRVASVLRGCIHHLRAEISRMSILQPFSFLLVDEDHETIQDLEMVDSEETLVLDGTLLQGLNEDLNAFLRQLLDE